MSTINFIREEGLLKFLTILLTLISLLLTLAIVILYLYGYTHLDSSFVLRSLSRVSMFVHLWPFFLNYVRFRATGILAKVFYVSCALQFVNLIVLLNLASQ